MRSKKTIRRMKSPLARRMAHLAREMQSKATELSRLSENVEEQDMLLKATERALDKRIQEAIKREDAMREAPQVHSELFGVPQEREGS
jgi:hypothetical protein